MLCAALALAVAAMTVHGANNQMCFYVDKGVPGHCFVQFLPKQGPQAGATNLVYGKYPATRDIFGGPGVIKNDSKRAWSQRICYPVTVAQYNAAAAKVRGKIAAPPPYDLVSNPPGNCVDWMTDAAVAAGQTLPGKTGIFGISTPGAFGDSLKGIGNGGTFSGGTVAFNSDPSQSPDGSPVALVTPHDWDAGETALASHDNPVGQAFDMELLLNQQDLGVYFTTPTDPMQLEVLHPNPDDALITVNWGDGTDLDGQQTSYLHHYAVPGAYPVSLAVIDSGALHHYTFVVEVSKGPIKNFVIAEIPPVEPNQDLNTGFEKLFPLEYICPADLDFDGMVGVTDFLILLAEWGTSPLGPPDIDGDGVVGIGDFLFMLATWGPCT
ncbi:MAG: hypothetical protein ACYSU7_03595 [Planctomycetota bacterium]|jgi:hypothetical protein